MEYNLVRESVKFDEKIGVEKLQLMLDGDIIVSDIKPDIETVLQKEAEIVIDNIEVTDNRVDFSGRLNIQVLYLSNTSKRAIHSMSTDILVDDFLMIEGVSKHTDVDFDAKILNIDYRVQNDRKISFNSIVEVKAICKEKRSYDIIKNIETLKEEQIKKDTIKLNQKLNKYSDRILIKDEMEVKSGSPNINEILQTKISVNNKEVRVHNNQVLVSGNLNVTALYRGDMEESLIEILEHETPFNGAFDLDGITDDMFADANLTIQDKYVQIRQDKDGEDRVVSFETSIGAEIFLAKEVTREVVADAYMIDNKATISTFDLCFDKLVSRNKTQSTVKEVVAISKESPSILQIFGVNSKCIVDDVTLSEDRVIVEGVVENNILYIAEDDKMPLYSVRENIPFSQVVETRGAKENMQHKVQANVEHTTFNMLNDREVDLRITVGLGVEVESFETLKIVENIEFERLTEEELENFSSITVYIVQKGDNLWDIAKKYNTTVEDLKLVNDLDDDNLNIGDKLMIIKKVNVIL